MEFCEKRIIKTRKKSLIDNTRLHVGLLAQLQGRGLLGNIEISKLEAVKRERGEGVALEYMYDVVTTKVDGFKILKNVLLASNQTGAARILDEKMKPFRYNYNKSQTKFFGRKEELTRLSQQILRPKQDFSVYDYITCIVGMGGIGKTELCKQYCDSLSEIDENISIFWINAEVNLATSFRKIAHFMGILDNSDNERDINPIISKIYSSLRGISYVVVFDNVKSFKLLKLAQYLPQTSDLLNDNSRFILTSRCHDSENILGKNAMFILDTMSIDDALMWVNDVLFELRNINESEQKQILTLVEKLDRLPLVFRQTLTYLKEKTKYSISDFLDDLEEKPVNILDQDEFLSESYKTTTLHTFDFSLAHLKSYHKYGNRAYDILTKCAYLNPDHIEMCLFDSNDVKLNDENKEAFRLLERLCLLKTFSPQVFVIHRILQKVIQCKTLAIKQESEILQSILQMRDLEVSHAQYIWKHVAKHEELIVKFYGNIFYGTRQMSPLHLLAERGDTKAFRKIVSVLNQNCKKELFLAFLNQKDKCSRTPAYFAASQGHCNILKVIHNFGGNFKISSSICYTMVERMKLASYDRTDWTPMHIAVYNNMSEVVLYLNSLKSLSLAAVQNSEKRKETPLVIAALLGNVELVEALTNDKLHIICALVSSAANEVGVDKLRSYLKKIPQKQLENILNTGMNSSQMTPMYVACFASTSAAVTVLDLLSRMGGNIKFGNIAQLYHYTIKNDNLQSFQWLCEENKKMSHENLGMCREWTPLHAAAKANSINILKYVIEGNHIDMPELNIDINKSDSKGDTPLYQAAYNGNLNIVKYLVEKNANINSVNKWGSTPIIAASLRGKFDVVEFLANQKDVIFQPSLIVQARGSLLDILNLYVIHAVIVHEKIDMISSLLDIIVKKEPCAKECLLYGVSGNITLLHVAAFFDCPRSIKYLKEIEFLDGRCRSSVYEFVKAFYLTITKHGFGVPTSLKWCIRILLGIMELFPRHWFQVTPHKLANILGNDKCMALLEKDEDPPNILENIVYSICAHTMKQYQQKMKQYVSSQNNWTIPAAEDASDLVVRGFLGCS